MRSGPEVVTRLRGPGPPPAAPKRGLCGHAIRVGCAPEPARAGPNRGFRPGVQPRPGRRVASAGRAASAPRPPEVRRRRARRAQSCGEIQPSVCTGVGRGREPSGAAAAQGASRRAGPRRRACQCGVARTGRRRTGPSPRRARLGLPLGGRGRTGGAVRVLCGASPPPTRFAPRGGAAPAFPSPAPGRASRAADGGQDGARGTRSVLMQARGGPGASEMPVRTALRSVRPCPGFNGAHVELALNPLSPDAGARENGAARRSTLCGRVRDTGTRRPSGPAGPFAAAASGRFGPALCPGSR
jgi:hypothetical protein